MSNEQKSMANGQLMANAMTNQAAQANCVTSTAWGYLADPYGELRQLVTDLKKAMEPPTAREKRLQARVAELEAKLAEIKKAAG